MLKLLSPRQYFRFYEFEMANEQIVILEIEKASHRPVQFKGSEYIKVGSYKKLLKDFPEIERELWRTFDINYFEEIVAMEHLDDSEVLKYLDYPRCFDKFVSETEDYQLPAPIVEVIDEHTKVILFSHIPFPDMSKEDRMRACYLHACLKYVTREYLTNTTLRDRFGLDEKDISIVSRIIRDTIDAGMIRAVDPDTSPRYLKYVPFWA